MKWCLFCKCFTNWLPICLFWWSLWTARVIILTPFLLESSIAIYSQNFSASILLGFFTGTVPYEFDWKGINAHIYHNHMDEASQYINNKRYARPKLRIKGITCLKDIEDLKNLRDIKNHFELVGYENCGNIKAELKVGLWKH